MVAGAYGNDEGIDQIVQILSSEYFCKSAELGLDNDQLEVCQEIIKQFMPPALKVLAAYLAGGAENVCHEWYEGIC